MKLFKSNKHTQAYLWFAFFYAPKKKLNKKNKKNECKKNPSHWTSQNEFQDIQINEDKTNSVHYIDSSGKRVYHHTS